MEWVTVRGYEGDKLVREFVDVNKDEFTGLVNLMIEEGLDIEFVINPEDLKQK